MMYGGEPVDAETALDWGLVNAVFEDDRLEGEALRFSSRVASRSRQASSLLKRKVRQGMDRTLAEGLELERQAVRQVDRKSVGMGQGVAVRVDTGGRRIIKQKKQNK